MRFHSGPVETNKFIFVLLMAAVGFEELHGVEIVVFGQMVEPVGIFLDGVCIERVLPRH